MPEIPLLAVLPGTGGLTRVTDKRKVRRDLADVFSTLEEGVRGEKARSWRLVDEVAVNSRFEGVLDDMVKAEMVSGGVDGERPNSGISLTPIHRDFNGDEIRYSSVTVSLDRDQGLASICVFGPDSSPPSCSDELIDMGDQFWGLRAARELDDALLHLRFNETEPSFRLPPKH